MPVTFEDLLLKVAAANPGDDTSTAGGAPGAATVFGSSPGELLPFLEANDVGTVDVEVQQQWQKAFFLNSSATSGLKKARIYLRNGLVRPSSGTGRIYVVLTDVRDANRQVRLQENVGGLIVTEAINTPSNVGTGSATTGVYANIAWAERAQLVDVSGNQVGAFGDVQLWWGNNINTAILLGVIPGASRNGLTWSWATGEIKLLGISSVYDTNASSGDTSTIPNRRTPTGLSGFASGTTYATGIVPRLDVNNDTLGPLLAQGFWIQQTLQPGMPAADTVQYCWRIAGSSGA